MSPTAAPLILVIEDNPPLRRMLAVTLRTAGYRVLEATDGRDAVTLAAGELPALVIQDLMLPDVDAATLLAELRAIPGAERLPVLAASGSEEKLAELREQAGSFSDFLLKPIDSTVLLQVIDSYAPAASEPSAGGQRLLLADDDAVQRKLAALHLERLGFEVALAADGEEALASARLNPPDLIVSDVLMPALDGFELCHAIRTDPQLGRIPVVLISSAYIATEDRELALRCGASALVERTPDLAELLETVSTCLSGEAAHGTPVLDFAVEHARRIRAQLERQAGENLELRARAAVTAVDLSVLAGISGAVTRTRGRAGMLAETLPRCLEAGGLSAACVWLFGDDGDAAEAAHAGPPASVTRLARLVRAELRKGLPEPGMFEPSGAGGAGTVLCVKLGPLDAPLGVLALAWEAGDAGENRIAFTRAIAGQMSEGLALERAFDELESSRAETISRLALAAESRDGLTARHTERVSAVAAMLAAQAGLAPEHVELIRVASLMHDVGKIGVSDTILLKPGSLTDDEFDQIKEHTTIGHRILAGSDLELLQIAATIALTHHERVDGTGYPQGLSGPEIPIEGRIVAVADVFDALTSDRSYRPAMPIEQAIEIMVAGRGSHFDARLLDLLLDSLEQIVPLTMELSLIAG